MTRLILLLVFYVFKYAVYAWKPSCSFRAARRQMLQEALALTFASTINAVPQRANAARGAAELDLEYYARDLLGGNRKEGNVQPLHMDLPPPRTLKEPLLSLLLSDDSLSLPVVALIQQVRKLTGNDEKSIRNEILLKIDSYRDKASRGFAARAPWNEAKLSDQYYFDLTSYALWRTAADMLPNYVNRDIYVRQVGRLLYEHFQTDGLVPRVNLPSKCLTSTLPRIREVLEVFRVHGFCKDFRVGDSNDEPVFDALDDDALAGGATVDCLVSVFEPATLGASLQITGEQSRFAPDYCGAVLAAMWESAGIRSTWETFFVDNEYRSNPKDYFPNEQLYQYSLSASKANTPGSTVTVVTTGIS